MRIETDKIYCGDSLQVLQTLPENAVDCCVTSPPYYALRDYGADGQIGREATPEEYVSRITAVFHEVKRVLTPEGTCWLNIADTYCGRQQSRPPRPQISQRQERAASGVQPPRPRL
jgi:DNA modification methylase